MSWDHPHTTRRPAGKGPKGKKQRRILREQAEAAARQENPKTRHSGKHYEEGTLASVQWRPGLHR